VLFAAWLAVRNAPTALVRNAGCWAAGALGLQLLIAFAMILKAFPLSLATAHNAGAALLIMALLVLNRRLREA
jgi:cytochrome c oxidase assembly protein subunit 15